MLINIKDTDIRVELTIGQWNGKDSYYDAEPTGKDAVKHEYGWQIKHDAYLGYIADEKQIDELEQKIEKELDKINSGMESKDLDRYLELDIPMEVRKSELWQDKFDENGAPRKKYVLKKRYWPKLTQSILNGMTNVEIENYATRKNPDFPTPAIVAEEICRRAGLLDELRSTDTSKDANDVIIKASNKLGMNLSAVTTVLDFGFVKKYDVTLGNSYILTRKEG